ncbi:hypothetical protein GCM10022237_14660 [Nocardioides ginsengisoli]|uniref:Glycosyltransferase RgtA/B/C/D-like domain-containing protein n=1 Tax=Nocardioides ginsengisoli TaxID=363868 RepID=A0ABW3VZ34_9ACTN
MSALTRRLPAAPVLLGWLVVAHVVLKILVFPLVMNVPGHGDEQAYLNGAMALSNTIRDLAGATTPHWAELDRNFVASGWFMPGMSIVVAPLYLVVPDAGPGLVRLYIGVLMLILFVLVLRRVSATLGPKWAVVIAVFPGLVPMWVIFTYGAWGDTAAGLLMVLVSLRLIEMFRGFRKGEAPSIKDGAVLGLLSIAALYLRSSTSILLAGLGVVTLIAAVVLLRGKVLRRALGAAAVAGVLFVALLAPWSAYASHVLGGRVITTTTVPTVEANTFGDRSQVCFGKCDPDSTLWFRPLRYAREVGRATGTSEVDVLKQMSDYALADVTVGGYLEQVDHNLAAYALQPAIFIEHLTPEGGRGTFGSIGAGAAEIATWLLYFPVLLLAAASLVTVARRSLEARVLDVLVKLVLGALLVQPFVHVAGGRYWTTAGPFFAIAATILVRERLIGTRRMRPPDDGVLTATDARIVTWLGRIQVFLATAVAVVAIVLAASTVF